MTSYYSRTAFTRNTLAKAEDVNTQLAAIQSGFEKLPTPHASAPTTKGFNEVFKIVDATSRDHPISAGQIQDQGVSYVAAGGTANALTATLAPAISAYAAGMRVCVLAASTNTGAVTINVNSKGARAITKSGATALTGGEITAGMMLDLLDDGTQFQLTGAFSTLTATLLDEDDMASDSATNPASQQSIKYYIDNDVKTVAQGGTGASTLTDGSILVGAGTSAIEAVAVGLETEILVGGGAGTNPVWTTVTGTGAPVKATSPTLVTPALGTPSAGVLTSCTGLPGSGLASGFPVLYERSTQLARSAADTVTVYEDTAININGTIFIVASDTALELNTNGTWDTGTALNDAARAGNDYYVYACDNSGTLALLVSANSTTPTGYAAATSRKIGGFHCLCVAAGTIAGHTLTNFAQGDVLPASVWDLKHRPVSSPEGMVFSEAADIWVDIYLASGTGASTVSVNGGTISDTRDWNDFVDDFGAVKKQLLDDIEFQLIAAGSNEETNNAGHADPVITGGNSDTVGQRMISNIGCEDCCGALYQWLSTPAARADFDIGADTGDVASAGYYDLPNDKGSFYTYGTGSYMNTQLRAGGDWNDAAYCGSRSRDAYYYRWNTHTNLGGRGRSRKL